MVAQKYTGSAIVKIHRFSRDLTDQQSSWQLPLIGWKGVLRLLEDEGSQRPQLNLAAEFIAADKNKQEFGGHLRDEAPLNLAKAVQSSSRVAVMDPYPLSTLLQMQGGNTFKTTTSTSGILYR
ncbi:hypothetical protein B0H14DRAFT_2620202 [Mycena olivaceomarginata]|nr:hypothetical protein B0H14DRAFT_2620202 [Mycena olivaceomarginata]